MEALHNLFYVLVDEAMVVYLRHPVLHFGSSGQLAVDEQVGDFEKGAVFGKLLDRVTAVTEDAALAVRKLTLLWPQAVFM
jgi:hypothetical protein